jgi:hypothetical protein
MDTEGEAGIGKGEFETSVRFPEAESTLKTCKA